MTLAEMTALMSRVGLRKPELMCDRSVALFIQECIEEAKDIERSSRMNVPAEGPDALQLAVGGPYLS